MDILTNPSVFNGVGVVGMSVFITIGFILGIIVPRRTHQDMKDDRDRWRVMAETLKTENTRLLIISEIGVNSIKAIEERAVAREAESIGGGKNV